MAAVPSQSQCQKQPATTIKLVGDECVNKVTLITPCDGDGGGDGDGDGGGDGDGDGDGGLPVVEHCVIQQICTQQRQQREFSRRDSRHGSGELREGGERGGAAAHAQSAKMS